MRSVIFFKAKIIIIFIFAFFMLNQQNTCARSLPYSLREKPYTGFSNTIRGDVRTVGMAGALVSMADSVISSMQNPAGLAMTNDGLIVQFSSNYISDAYIQDLNERFYGNGGGMGAGIFPWGFRAGYFTVHSESQAYEVNSLLHSIRTHLKIVENHFSVGRVFFGKSLSLGLDLIYGKAQQSATIKNPNTVDIAKESYKFGISAGAIYKFPKRFLLGASYTPEINYSRPTNSDGTNASIPYITNFFQPVHTPRRIYLGAGWIPNRFFRLGVGLYFYGTTPVTTPMADQTRLTGQKISIQPRLGASYTPIDFKNLKVQIYGGVYYETSRTTGLKGRTHDTLGLEVDPWIFSFGWAVDIAHAYTDHIVLGGLDLVMLARKLKLLPTPPQALLGGFLPKPFYMSDDGLPEPLQPVGAKHKAMPDVVGIAKETPSKLNKKIRNIDDELIDLGKDMYDSIKSIPLDMREDLKNKGAWPTDDNETESETTSDQTPEKEKE